MIRCVVVEEGTYTMAEDGVTMEARTYVSEAEDVASKFDWATRRVDYLNTYTSPVVVGQIQTSNDDSFVVFWARGGGAQSNPPTASRLFAGPHVGEKPSKDHGSETVGWIVFEAGVSSLDGLQVVAGVESSVPALADGSVSVDLTTFELPSSSVAVLSPVGMVNQDGLFSVLVGPDGATSTSLRMALDEDTLGACGGAGGVC